MHGFPGIRSFLSGRSTTRWMCTRSRHLSEWICISFSNRLRSRLSSEMRQTSVILTLCSSRHSNWRETSGQVRKSDAVRGRMTLYSAGWTKLATYWWRRLMGHLYFWMGQTGTQSTACSSLARPRRKSGLTSLSQLMVKRLITRKALLSFQLRRRSLNTCPKRLWSYAILTRFTISKWWQARTPTGSISFWRETLMWCAGTIAATGNQPRASWRLPVLTSLNAMLSMS